MKFPTVSHRAESRFVRIVAPLFLAALVATLAGCCCCGYNIGPGGLYHSEIKTVYVQMVEADTYREAFGERLTEAICKKITEQTPYRIATLDVADSVLAVRLRAENQTVSARNRYDDTRQKDVKLVATATWRITSADEIEAGVKDSSATGVMLTSQSYLVPEMGQSTATAQQEAIDKLANEIVGLMEVAW